MQRLDVNQPGMEDLQFVLLVSALCTSELPTLNMPESLRETLFARCWALVNEGPLPANPRERVLDLRAGTEVTLQALVETIRRTLAEAGIQTLTWDHPPSAPTIPSSPQAGPLVDRLQWFDPGETPPSRGNKPDS